VSSSGQRALALDAERNELIFDNHCCRCCCCCCQVNDGSNLSGLQVVVEPGVDGWELLEGGGITTGQGGEGGGGA
jgi:hypothetical protein